MKKKPAVALAVLLALGALLIAGTLALRWAWRHPGRALVIADHPARLDALVILGGERPERIERLVAAWREFRPPLVVLSGVGRETDYRAALHAAGLPDGHIVSDGGSRNTYENARQTIGLLRRTDRRRIGVVTSWYHTRRSIRTFRALGPEFEFSALGTPAPPRGTPLSREETAAVEAEFLKLIGYFLLHGISPI